MAEDAGATAGGGTGGSAARPGEHRRTTLRHGTAEEAGLLPGQLERLVKDAAAFLGPSPAHPWYAGAVLLAGRGGTVALHRPLGLAVRYRAYDEATGSGVEFPAGEQIATTEDTVFDLASVSKLFTAILAVQQIERGALELDGRVTAYLPEFGAAGKQDITVCQLLTHTSGLPAWIPLYGEPVRERWLQLLWNEAPAHAPGCAYLYSDLNLVTLQLILERITGRTLDVLLHDEITAPLGMDRTRYNPPGSWLPEIAATEDARPPWSGLDRGLVRGEVHDENAYGMGGVAGHAGVFSRAWDLAVLARTLLNGGAYGQARILRPESVRLMLTDVNSGFPGHAHGLGFELCRHRYMGAMATPGTAGHTGFTGTSLVLDRTTDSFLVVLGNSVHPVRSWRSGSGPRVAAANRLARAVPVRPERGGTAWFSGPGDEGAASVAGGTGGAGEPRTSTLTLPPLRPVGGQAVLRCSLWWDTEPVSEAVSLESSADGRGSWQAAPFTSVRAGRVPQAQLTGSVSGWSGRVWHRITADLVSRPGEDLTLRWRHTTAPPYTGRGVYVTGLHVESDGQILFDEARPQDAARIEPAGWQASED